MLALPLVALLTAAAGDLDATYDQLRDRLPAFVHVSDAPGGSLPAGWRHDGLGLMKWADATVAHGWYLGVLATEHHLRSAAGLDTTGTDEELALALGALERLDRVANAAFPPPCTQEERLDGFFVRDDVPADLHRHFDGITSLESDWIDPTPTNKEASQDQVDHLIMGLALVKRFVPDDVAVDGRPLRAWAVEQGTRILAWTAADRWILRNPACGDRSVARGAEAVGFAAGMAAVFRFLTDGAADLPSAEDHRHLWEPFASPDHPFYLNPDNLHLASVLAATGGGFGDDTLPALVDLAQRDGWWAYPLLHVALHGDVPAWDAHREPLLAHAHAILAELGEEEPLGPPAETRAAHGWTSWHRFIRPADQHYVGAAGRAGMRFSGLDWMLLHNLTAIATALPSDEPLPPTDDEAAPEAGCACASSGRLPVTLLALVAPLVLRRRRR